MTEAPHPIRLRPEIAALPAYRQGRPPRPGGYKLSSNENPFPPLPAVVEALRSTAALVNRYPDGQAEALRAAVADRHGTTGDRLHFGAGSISVLTQLISAVAGPGDEVVYAWRSFEAYPGIVAVAGATSVAVPVTVDGEHDLDAMAAVVGDRTRAVIVCSPNNPTGPIVRHEDLVRLLAAVPADVLVILDEAYIEFVTDDAVARGADLLPLHPNLVVLRTFSKAWGLAGVRLGYAIGDPRVLEAARSAAIALSVTDAAQLAGVVSLQHEDELRDRVAALVERRDRVRAGLLALGLRVPAAQGNFVWIPAGDDASAVAERFDDAGLVTRAFPGDGVRISIGEEESVEILLRTAADLGAVLTKGSTAFRVDWADAPTGPEA